MGELLASGAVAGFETEAAGAGGPLVSLLIIAAGGGAAGACDWPVALGACLLMLTIVRGASGGGSRGSCILRDSTTSFDCCRWTTETVDCCSADTAVVVLLTFSFVLL